MLAKCCSSWDMLFDFTFLQKWQLHLRWMPPFICCTYLIWLANSSHASCLKSSICFCTIFYCKNNMWPSCVWGLVTHPVPPLTWEWMSTMPLTTSPESFLPPMVPPVLLLSNQGCTREKIKSWPPSCLITNPFFNWNVCRKSSRITTVAIDSCNHEWWDSVEVDSFAPKQRNCKSHCNNNTLGGMKV